MLARRDSDAGRRAVRIADLFCRQAEGRVKTIFKSVFRNQDVPTYRAAQEVLAGEHRWLEQEIVDLPSLK
jgi:hypothetical protein